MKILLKIALYIIVVFLILLICSSIVLHHILKPDVLKKMIISEVQNYTGRTLTIGQLDYKLFPTFQLELGNVSLSNNPKVSSTPFLTVQQVNLGVEIKPLLKDQIELTAINVDNAQVNLIQNSQGNNWQDLVKNSEKNSNTTPNTNRTHETTNSTKDATVYIPAVNLQHLNINYQNNDSTTQFKNLYFIASNVRNDNSFFTFSAGSSITQTNPLLSITWTIDGKAAIAKNFLIYQLKDVKINSQFISAHEQQKFSLANLNTTIKLSPTQIAIKPLSASLYNGSISADALINLQTISNYQTNLTIANVNLNSLLSDLANINKIDGIINLQTSLNTRGQTSQQLIQNLTGNGHFQINQAGLQGIDIGQTYRTALAVIEHGKVDNVNLGNSSKIGNLTGSYAISQGIIHTQDTKYLSPVIRAEMSGNINLNNQLLNLVASVTPVKGSMDNLKDNGPTIPFNISGSFKQPKATPNLAGLVQSAIQQRVNTELQKVKAQLPNITNSLKGIFGN